MRVDFDDARTLPGRSPVAFKRSGAALGLAAIAGILWPPLWLTLLIWKPTTWFRGVDTDWRLIVLAVGVVAVPLLLWRLQQEHTRTGRPGTRLGVVWRFMFYGGILAVALQALVALIISVLGWVNSADPGQAIGFTETALLLFGVGGLPLAAVVGISYALWAGLCAAFIAVEPRPEVRDRLGMLQRL
jgi:hypothetical protein